MNSPSFPEGPGSVSGAPNLPDEFAGTFTSRYIDAGGLRQHVVTGGGDGPLLLLVHGWPPGHRPATRSGITSTHSPPTPKRYTPASRSTTR